MGPRFGGIPDPVFNNKSVLQMDIQFQLKGFRISTKYPDLQII